MNKKGFTLIELLAVIVILAIIALIATPTILGVIEKARKGAAESSAIGYIDAVEKQIMMNEVDTNNTSIKDGSYSIDDLTRLGVTVKGTTPSNGTLTIKDGEVSNYIMSIDNYVVENGKATKSSKTNEVKDNGTEIYFNPTTGEKCDNYVEDNSATGTKIGCMKWYVFNDSENNSIVNMILDHNTTARVAWNSSGNSANGMKEIAEALKNDTSAWKVPARLISAYEVAKIVKKTNFKISDDWFYLDSLDHDSTARGTTKGSSDYAWLYDRTRTDCESYGCANNSFPVNLNTYGYWTSTPSVNESNIWNIISYGMTSVNSNSNPDRGLRPVITISKDLVY